MSNLGPDITTLDLSVSQLSPTILRVTIGAPGRFTVPQNTIFKGTGIGVPQHAAASPRLLTVGLQAWVETEQACAHGLQLLAAASMHDLFRHAGRSLNGRHSEHAALSWGAQLYLVHGHTECSLTVGYSECWACLCSPGLPCAACLV